MSADAVQVYRGGCHCGNLRLEFASGKPPGSFEIRACQCEFCRRHDTLAVADADGQLRIDVAARAELSRYTFALSTAEFLLCANCGVYVAAVTNVKPPRALVLVRALERRAEFTQAPLDIDYDNESRTQRVERRRVSWTPIEIRYQTE